MFRPWDITPHVIVAPEVFEPGLPAAALVPAEAVIQPRFVVASTAVGGVV